MSVISELPVIERGQIWKNKKLKTEYEVLAIATCCDNSKNNQQCIIYTRDGELYTRCRDEFLQHFTQVER
jgi:hypothetical protein